MSAIPINLTVQFPEEQIVEALRSKGYSVLKSPPTMKVQPPPEPPQQHLPEPPPDIVEAADKVGRWFRTNGYEDWALGPCADRRKRNEDLTASVIRHFLDRDCSVSILARTHGDCEVAVWPHGVTPAGNMMRENGSSIQGCLLILRERLANKRNEKGAPLK